MATPTASELRQALDRALAMRDTGNDPDYLAKSLLNLHYRLLRMERVAEAARRYLNSGQSVTEHRLLMQAVHEAEEEENGLLDKVDKAARPEGDRPT